MTPRFRITRLIALVAAALALWAGLFQLDSRAGDTVIGFDDLAPGTVVTSQYHSLGIDFIANPAGGSEGDGVPVVRADAKAVSPPNVASIRVPGCTGAFCVNVTWGRFTAPRQHISVSVGDYGPQAETAQVHLYAVGVDGTTALAEAVGTVTSGDGYATRLTVSSAAANIWYFVVRTPSPATRSVAIDDLSFDSDSLPPTPDFGLLWKAPHPPAIPVTPGDSYPTTIHVTRYGGSVGDITLSIGALPVGVTGSFAPNPASGNADADITLTLKATDTAPPVDGVPVTITGTPGGPAVGPAPRSVVILVTVRLAPPAALPAQPAIKYGGRTVAVDVSPSLVSTGVAIAASESGGLFLTADTGRHWAHVDTLPPFRMSDVKFAPGDSRIIIASAFADTHPGNQGGIWRSTDSGVSWQKPMTSNPPVSTTCGAFANTYGIAFAGASSNAVYVGTDCGLAVSNDLGATWTHVVPSTTSPRVLGVVAQGGIVDTCGDDGHHRSTDGAASFGAADTGLPNCTYVHGIAASPLESKVIFATRYVPLPAGCTTAATAVFEGDINKFGSITWTQIGPTVCKGGGRDPWVTTHLSADGDARHFDLFFGSGLNVYRQTCTNTPPAGGGGTRCSTAGGATVSVDHGDQNALAYGPAGNCAQYLASDGGVHMTTDCGATWKIAGSSSNGFHALQLYEVTGQVHPAGHTDLYIGTQDNNLWASADAGATWPGEICCEGFYLQTPHSYPSDAAPVTGVACGECWNFKAAAHFAGSPSAWPNSPSTFGNPFLVAPDLYMQYGQPSPPASTLYINSPPGSWTPRVTVTQTLADRPWVSGPPLAPTVYEAVTKPGGKTGLVKITGIKSGSVTVSRADSGLDTIGEYCMGQGTFLCVKVFGVDPNDPSHLIAADLGASAMKVSTDGGVNWVIDPVLTNLVTASGALLFVQPDYLRIGVWNFQPHVIAFDPADGKRILVGTEAAGIIASTDGGATWRTLPWSSRVTAISAFFFDEVHNTVYVSSYGRGLWKIDGAVFTAAAQVGAPAAPEAHPVSASRGWPTPILSERPVPTDTRAHPEQNDAPYLQLVGTIPITGQTLAYPGETITAYGSGFCAAPGCGPVVLSVDDQVSMQGVPVAADGRFVAAIPVVVNTRPGRFLVTASQITDNNLALMDQQYFGVPIGDRAENEAGAPRVYLPMVGR